MESSQDLARFEEIRALMQSPAPTQHWEYPDIYSPVDYSDEWLQAEAWRDRVCALILEMSSQAPDVYARQWLPYLASFPEHWRLPLGLNNYALGSPPTRFSRELHDATSSFACFAFQATSNSLNGSMFRNPKKCEALAGLVRDFTHVNFSDHYLTAEGGVNLAGCEGLSHLTHLVLAGCHIGDEGVLALARSPHLTGLVMLDVSLCGVSDAAWTDLCATHRWSRLHTLKIAGHDVSAHSLSLLLDAASFPALVHLDVRMCGWTRSRLERFLWWRQRRPELVVQNE